MGGDILIKQGVGTERKHEVTVVMGRRRGKDHVGCKPNEV